MRLLVCGGAGFIGSHLVDQREVPGVQRAHRGNQRDTRMSSPQFGADSLELRKGTGGFHRGTI